MDTLISFEEVYNHLINRRGWEEKIWESDELIRKALNQIYLWKIKKSTKRWGEYSSLKTNLEKQKYIWKMLICFVNTWVGEKFLVVSSVDGYKRKRIPFFLTHKDARWNLLYPEVSDDPDFDVHYEKHVTTGELKMFYDNKDTNWHDAEVLFKYKEDGCIIYSETADLNRDSQVWFNRDLFSQLLHH